eukprot:EG_transcript_2602
MSANSVHDPPHKIQEMEDFLRRISDINAVVANLMEDVKTGAPDPPEPTAPPKPAPGQRYSVDYSRWDRLAEEEAAASQQAVAKEGIKALEERLCQEEAARSKEAGNVAFQAGRYVEAHEAYTRAMALAPDDIVHPLNRALCNLRLERWAEGLQDCAAVLRVEPHHPKALTRRATILQRTDRFAEALEVWQKVLKLNPRSREAKDNIQVCQEELQERNRLQQFVAGHQDDLVARLQAELDRLLPAVAALVPRPAPASDPTPALESAPDGVLRDPATATAPQEAAAGPSPAPSEAEHTAHVLVSLGRLPPLLDTDGSHIYLRVHGGLAAVLRLLRHTMHRQPLSSPHTLLFEGLYSVLACSLPNAFNLASFVREEQKVAEGAAAADSSVLAHAVQCVAEGERPLGQAALNFLATVTADAWAQQHLRRWADAARLCALPSHNKSGLSLALITRIIDNCLRSNVWREEFRRVDLLTFLLTFASAEYSPLRRNVAGCVMRLTTVDHFRAELTTRDAEGAYRHLPAVLRVLKSEVVPKGSTAMECRSPFVMEALLSTLVNCVVGEAGPKAALCRWLHAEGVLDVCRGLVEAYGARTLAAPPAGSEAGPPPDEGFVAVLCRAVNLLAKAIILEDVLRSLASDARLLERLVQLANHYGLAVAVGKADTGDHYREGIAEHASVVLGAVTRPQPAADGGAAVYPDWPLLAGLLTHPNNNVCGNVALVVANLAERPEAAGPMGQAKVHVVDLLVEAIKARRNEAFQASDGQSFRHSKNTAANNRSCQMNCAIALAKLARDEANWDRLRDLQGMEILHTVLQQR